MPRKCLRPSSLIPGYAFSQQNPRLDRIGVLVFINQYVVKPLLNADG